MRLVLVDNLLVEHQGGAVTFVPQPHLGLISLLAVAEGAGHEVALFDPKLALHRGQLSLDASLYRDVASRVLALGPEVVGLTTLGCNFVATLKVARYLKKARPDLPILLGGPHATVLDRAILGRFTEFDLIVRNEAELKLLPVLEELELRRGDLSRVPGITYRAGDEVRANPGDPVIANLDDLPIPAYHHYPVRELGLTSLRIDAGRGCPFRCTFCSTATFFGRKYRLKSAARLTDELDQLHAAFGVSHFSLTHDMFTANRAKVLGFCAAVAGRGYTWDCSARTDCVDPDLLQVMAAAGCREIYYGIETGSPRMQRLVEKGLDLGGVRDTLRATERAGIKPTASFITGYPQEEVADQELTLDLIGDCLSLSACSMPVQLHLLSPEPGTKMLKDYADCVAYDGHVSDFNSPLLELDDADVIARNPDVFVNYHYFMGAMPRKRTVLVAGLYQLLHNLGRPLLVHLLGRFENRLGVLVQEFLEWESGTRSRSGPSGAQVIGFLRHRFGDDHYLCSLAKYMLTAAVLEGRIPADGVCEIPGVGREDTSCESLFSAGERVAILTDCHDCPAILRQLVFPECGTASVPDHLRDRRDDYLVRLDGNSLRVVRVTKAVAMIFRVLVGPSREQAQSTLDCIPADRIESLARTLQVLTAGGFLTPRVRMPVEDRLSLVRLGHRPAQDGVAAIPTGTSDSSPHAGTDGPHPGLVESQQVPCWSMGRPE